MRNNISEMSSNIRETVRQYILEEFLPGEAPEELTDSTPLITGGVLDSIATLKLVVFLEERFAVNFNAHETDAEHLDTVDRITHLVQTKMN